MTHRMTIDVPPESIAVKPGHGWRNTRKLLRALAIEIETQSDRLVPEPGEDNAEYDALCEVHECLHTISQLISGYTDYTDTNR